MADSTGGETSDNAKRPSRPHAFLVKGALGQRTIAPLSAARDFFTGVPKSEVSQPREGPIPNDHSQRTVAFHDPSSLPDNPGWVLRNILYYLHHAHSISSINVICLRSGSASRKGFVSVPATQEAETGERPQTVGWERNKAGKLGSRVADLGPMMDPAR